LLKTVESGVDFVGKQAPHVVQEMITWGVWANGLSTVVCILTFVCCITFLILKRNEINRGFEEQPGYFIYMIFAVVSIVLSVISFILMFYSTYWYLRAALTPHLYVIDCLKDYL